MTLLGESTGAELAPAPSTVPSPFLVAEAIIQASLSYTGINPNTAPIRYKAAERAAIFATYTALGLAGNQEIIDQARQELSGRDWQHRLHQAAHMRPMDPRITDGVFRS